MGRRSSSGGPRRAQAQSLPYLCSSVVPTVTVTIRPLQQADAVDLAANCFPDLPPDEVLERVREDLALREKGEGITLVAVEAGRVGVHVKLLKSRPDAGTWPASAPDGFSMSPPIRISAAAASSRRSSPTLPTTPARWGLSGWPRTSAPTTSARAAPTRKPASAASGRTACEANSCGMNSLYGKA